MISSNDAIRLVCPACGRHCGLETGKNPDGGIRVRGNSCSNGEDFARAELTDPRRTLRTSVAAAYGGRLKVLIEGVPADKVLRVMDALDGIVAAGPLAPGDSVAEDFLGLGLRVVALESLAPVGE